MGMKEHQLTSWVGGVIVISLALGLILPAQESESGRDLPGYYEFFLKTGKLSRLKSEVKRDEAIQTGTLKPVAVNKPVIELKLPDGFEVVHSTRAYVGKKNLVLITGRAWW
jgi:hypothetical protein